MCDSLQTLMEVYDEQRQRTGRTSPNEAEFRAYQLLVFVGSNERYRVRERKRH